jgi:hypothetical protein
MEKGCGTQCPAGMTTELPFSARDPLHSTPLSSTPLLAGPTTVTPPSLLNPPANCSRSEQPNATSALVPFVPHLFNPSSPHPHPGAQDKLGFLAGFPTRRPRFERVSSPRASFLPPTPLLSLRSDGRHPRRLNLPLPRGSPASFLYCWLGPMAAKGGTARGGRVSVAAVLVAALLLGALAPAYASSYPQSE